MPHNTQQEAIEWFLWAGGEVAEIFLSFKADRSLHRKSEIPFDLENVYREIRWRETRLKVKLKKFFG